MPEETKMTRCLVCGDEMPYAGSNAKYCRLGVKNCKVMARKLFKLHAEIIKFIKNKTTPEEFVAYERMFGAEEIKQNWRNW